MILKPLQKLPNNVGNLGEIIVATSFEWLPKVQKIAQSGHTGLEQNQIQKQNICHKSGKAETWKATDKLSLSAFFLIKRLIKMRQASMPRFISKVYLSFPEVYRRRGLWVRRMPDQIQTMI